VSLDCLIVREVLLRCNLVAAARLVGVSLAVLGVYPSLWAPMHPQGKGTVFCGWVVDLDSPLPMDS